MQLPTADNIGRCNDNNFVKFENAMDSMDNGCIRSFSITPNGVNNTFNQECNYQQSVSRYVNDLWVAM